MFKFNIRMVIRFIVTIEQYTENSIKTYEHLR